MIMGNFSTQKVDPEMVEAIDFMVERVSKFFIILHCLFSLNSLLEVYYNKGSFEITDLIR